MSNSLAIAAVTAALRRRLADHLIVGLPATLPAEFDINSARVTAGPPDRARSDNNKVNQLNLHLFRVAPNAALRNHDFPTPMGGGPGPLALDLHYLLTAYGPGDDEIPAHVILGSALRILHERPVLTPAELRAALPGGDASLPVEAVRLTPQALSIDELGKLWGLYHTPARVGAVVCASLVLIEPAVPRVSPLPVLRRALDVRPDTFAYPALTAVEPPQARPFALPGDVLTVRGHRLAAVRVRVRLQHPRLAAPVDLSPAPGSTDTVLKVTLPADPKALPAGPLALSVVLGEAGDERTTDAHPLALAPEITAGLPVTLERAGNGSITLELGVRPELRVGQRVALLLGDRELPVALVAATTSLAVTVANATPGEHLVRLRVDGVDSDVLDRDAPTPQFAADRKVRIA